MQAKLNRANVIVFLNLLALLSCKQPASAYTVNDTTLDFEKKLDSISSARIDSAYASIRLQCDSAYTTRLPLLVDSILKHPTDTAR